MSKTKRFLMLLLTFLFMVALFIPYEAEAATSAAPAVPKFKIKVNADNTVTVTILKTKNADGFEIYWCGNGKAYDGYHQKVLKKDGTKQRSINLGTFVEGKYKIYTRSYRIIKDETVYSKNSGNRTANIKVPDNSTSNDLTSTEEYSRLKTGDSFVFGSYEQDGNLNNGKEPIEWIVLSNSGNELFVMSKYILDNIAYNEEQVQITWAECTLREWLNDVFYNAAFSETEKQLIIDKALKNNDNPESGTIGGKDTNDKVFLLSYEDTLNPDYGFPSIEFGTNENDTIKRRCAPTIYAVSRGVSYMREGEIEYWTPEGELSSIWWLRSPGRESATAMEISENGCISFMDVYSNCTGVRPALCIKLNP